uniref:Uncharacterized protein n=1 Tax=Tetranychus urticae TaxID=32264 RepID=T1K2B7_TETUR
MQIYSFITSYITLYEFIIHSPQDLYHNYHYRCITASIKMQLRMVHLTYLKDILKGIIIGKDSLPTQQSFDLWDLKFKAFRFGLYINSAMIYMCQMDLKEHKFHSISFYSKCMKLPEESQKRSKSVESL